MASKKAGLHSVAPSRTIKCCLGSPRRTNPLGRCRLGHAGVACQRPPPWPGSSRSSRHAVDGLAGQEGQDVLHRAVQALLQARQALVAHVRRHQDRIGMHGAQGVVLRQGLGAEDVQSRTESALAQQLGKDRLVHDTPARDVHEKALGPKEPQQLFGDDALCLLGQRHADADDVRVQEELRERVGVHAAVGRELSLLREGVAQELLHLEGLEELRQAHADLAHAHDANSLGLQVVLRGGRPLAFLNDLVALREAAKLRQHKPNRQLGRGFRGVVWDVGHCDTPCLACGDVNVVDAGERHCQELQLRHLGKHARPDRRARRHENRGIRGDGILTLNPHGLQAPLLEQLFHLRPGAQVHAPLTDLEQRDFHGGKPADRLPLQLGDGRAGARCGRELWDCPWHCGGGDVPQAPQSCFVCRAPGCERHGAWQDQNSSRGTARQPP
mmetsp:Transcript_116707/g.362614  ORF Transcript_116707/g.362614 Transcript_116707/m.362614 type:complete len:441 (-) Transcript_116707:22-1344(-)